jgi:Uma2 family endonuclease
MSVIKDPSVFPAISKGGAFWEKLQEWQSDPVMQRIQPKGMPLLYGDEDFEMGESTIHTITAGMLLYGLGYHFALQTAYRVFGDLNLYYSDDDPSLYLSPDVMVVKASRALPAQLSSYHIGRRTPVPLLVGEVLSERTWQQGDLNRKPRVYSAIGVAEYMLVDVTGEMLEQRLLMLRRQPDGRWIDEQDVDGGITSHLGFRVVPEADGQLRVIDAKTGKRYARPDEAQTAMDQLATAQGRIRALEEELARLRGAPPEEEKAAKKGKRRKGRS